MSYREDVWEGLERAPEAFAAMLRGGNFGKTLVQVGEDPTLDEQLRTRREEGNVLKFLAPLVIEEALPYVDTMLEDPVVVGRLFNVVGPRQTGAYGMVLPRFAQCRLIAFANRSESTVSIKSNAATAIFALLRCKWPTICQRTGRSRVASATSSRLMRRGAAIWRRAHRRIDLTGFCQALAGPKCCITASM